MNDYDTLEAAKKLFTLRDSENGFDGLLYPTEGGVYPYDFPALSVYGRIYPKDDKYTFFACISSIDDSGVSIYGPVEEQDKAKDRMNKFKEFISNNGFACPNRLQLSNICLDIGTYADWW